MLDFRQSLINSTLRKVLKRLHYPLEVMLTCVRWYVAYPLSLRHIEEMIAKNAVFSWIVSRFIAGRSRFQASGNISIAPSIVPVWPRRRFTTA